MRRRNSPAGTGRKGASLSGCVCVKSILTDESLLLDAVKVRSPKPSAFIQPVPLLYLLLELRNSAALEISRESTRTQNTEHRVDPSRFIRSQQQPGNWRGLFSNKFNPAPIARPDATLLGDTFIFATRLPLHQRSFSR